MAGNRRTELVPSRDANGRRPATYKPQNSTTVTLTVTVAATGFAVRARAADSTGGLVLDRCRPRAEPVDGTFMRVLDMLLGPVVASGA